MYHIAATLGYTVSELDERLTLQEYMGWVSYFEEMNKSQEEKKPNLLDGGGQTLLTGMGL